MTEVYFGGIDKLLKLLKSGERRVKVGILGDNERKSTDGPNNATVGAYHEYGGDGMPQRSFLRMPISLRLDKELPKFLSKDDMKKALKSGNVAFVLKRMGIAAEACIADAFDSNGFGMWPPSNMRRKKVHQTLVETQQLRNSITSEVDD